MMKLAIEGPQHLLVGLLLCFSSPLIAGAAEYVVHDDQLELGGEGREGGAKGGRSRGRGR
ncbi:hypothetical protein BCR35DRAFT_303882 [Leucosporidium creatinivorum]|uniref:Uncharacterized protein n=1 Tax=Leucosporidium creatinivorum TaxID=106004 RepID=A0A1Y2FCU8_9BASI|nr:hypothetical protein BCR35DRAFT_303882 [Leucosporidium creatinivorum]